MNRNSPLLIISINISSYLQGKSAVVEGDVTPLFDMESR